METDTYYHNLIACDSFDELFRIWKSKSPQEIKYDDKVMIIIDHQKNGFISDGIVNMIQWGDGDNKKILFVLKEAYGENQEWDLAEWLRDQHPTISIWKRIAKWTYGLQNTDSKTICPYILDLPEEQRIRSLDQIAVINLKKSNGDSSSDMTEVSAYAQADRQELMKEFELIDPDIIVCGSTFHTLITEVFGMQPLKGDKVCDNFFYWLDVAGKRRLFLDYYHPANHWDDLMNYYGLVNIYQQALIAERREKENA